MLQMYLPDWRKNTLDKYIVKIYPRAIQELDKIYKYIAIEKQSQQTAKKQANRIKKKILSLDTFPEMHQDRLTGKFADKGYKQLLIDNYIVIYKIDNNSMIVYVITIQYQGRNL